MNAENAPPRRPVLLVIMDGIGVNPSRRDNAVALASTPNLDDIYAANPVCLLEASGAAVGLPDGQMGNSEVGHLSLGAGTVLKQDLVKINDAIEDGSFAENPALVAAIDEANARQRPVHLIGLVSDGGVHSHVDHLIALIELCADKGARPVLHMITDGRDTAPNASSSYLGAVEASLKRAGGCIATVIGRYYALDRDKRWDRIESAWRAVVLAEGRAAGTAGEAIALAGDAGENDEFITPTVLDGGVAKPEAGDRFVFFNFRNDRPRELTEALSLDGFDAFDRGDVTSFPMTTMTRYESSYPFPIAYQRDKPDLTLGRIVSDSGLTQLRAAETEKFPHVTFFFNGGQDEPLKGEERLMANSPKVATYDLQPEMSAEEITDGVLAALEAQEHALIVLNLANGDMVGHTGVPEAVVKAVETVDTMVGRLWKAAAGNGYSVVLTADHGNADMLVDPVSGEPHTQHTTYPVACTVHDENTWLLGCGHGLPSIAPTILQLMGLPQPATMKGRSILLGKR